MLATNDNSQADVAARLLALLIPQMGVLGALAYSLGVTEQKAVEQGGIAPDEVLATVERWRQAGRAGGIEAAVSRELGKL